jgi:DNA-directed RNA polymerase subunit RPC12/RpoP
MRADESHGAVECPACRHRFEAHSDPEQFGNYCPRCGHGFHGGSVR